MHHSYISTSKIKYSFISQNKMNNIIYFKVLFILVNAIHCFKKEDFCILPERILQHVRCKEYSCGNKMCSLLEEECKSLNFWHYLTNTNIVSFSHAHSRYKKILKSLRECSPDKYVFMNTEVCLNKICYETNTKASRFRLRFKEIKVRMCECKGEHAYKCGYGHCATNKNACKRILEKVENLNFIKNIKTCE